MLKMFLTHLVILQFRKFRFYDFFIVSKIFNQEWVPHDPMETNSDPFWSANYNAPQLLSQR